MKAFGFISRHKLKSISVFLVLVGAGVGVAVLQPSSPQQAPRAVISSVESIDSVETPVATEVVIEKIEKTEETIVTDTVAVEPIDTEERPVSGEEMFHIVSPIVNDMMPVAVYTERVQRISRLDIHGVVSAAYKENPHLFTPSYTRDFTIRCIESLDIIHNKSRFDKVFYKCPA